MGPDRSTGQFPHSSMVREGVAQLESGNLVSALSTLNHAHLAAPNYAPALHYLANVLLALGRAEEGVQCAYEAHLRDPESAPIQSNLLLSLLYDPSRSPEVVAEVHKQWGARYGEAASTPVRVRHDRVRVGYLSANFSVGPDAFFLEPVIRYHDRRDFEVYCYTTLSGSDWRSEQFRELADQWRIVAGLSAEAIASQIRADEVDILVECSGHFGASPVRAFCSQPAPVQIGFPIYPATVGLPNISHRITDSLVDPIGVTDSLHSESLIRLPEVFTCYTPFDGAPPVNRLPVLEGGTLTFGCFNRLHKLNSTVIRTWARILLEIHDSRLLLHHAFAGLHESPGEITTYIRGRFEQYGVDPERILFHGACPLPEHLALYHRVDIALDPFPYAGMTTTCDSLWMGVPVLTLAGKAHISRVGMARMSVLELEDWIARDEDDYVNIAITKSRDVQGLAELRRTLRGRMLDSPITNAHRYVQHLELAYKQIYGRWTDVGG